MPAICKCPGSVSSSQGSVLLPQLWSQNLLNHAWGFFCVALKTKQEYERQGQTTYQKENFCPCFNVLALFLTDQVHLGELSVSQIFTSKKEGVCSLMKLLCCSSKQVCSGLFAEQLVSHSSLLFFGTGEVDRSRISRLIQCRPVDLLHHAGVAVLC